MDIRRLKPIPVVLIVLALVIGGPTLFPSLGDFLENHDEPIAVVGNPAALQATYARWKQDRLRRGSPSELVLPLHYSKGLSARFTTAHGLAKLDLETGAFAAMLTGVPDTPGYDVWLVDNRPGGGRSVKPEPGDRMIRVGTLQASGDSRRLVTTLDRETMRGFEIDLVVIAPEARRPGQQDLLIGSPTLFQRMYVHERRRSGPDDLPPGVAYAGTGQDAVARLVARGEQLFFNETFEGNGRTCGTCHPAENNFTIDPAFIATLPPEDPLFVAEFNPRLAQLEIPALLRGFGLILENVDGFEPDPTRRFVMRGVPHTLALPTSLTIDPPPARGAFPQQRTGWSGDGAPNTGSLRDFATGAVTQHFPRTLRRVPGVDFRLPTEAELDAMEAFQLSLGRQADMTLPLPLKGAVARRGQEIFLDDNVGKCNRCHFNAGASTKMNPRDNANFDTGVERLVDQPARLVRRFPCDGGFGRDANPRCGPDRNRRSFGNNEFNTPPLVEAADTGPLFHNNAIKTIEGGVAFYNSRAFNETTIGQAIGGIALEPTQVEAVAAFLRVVNGLENIRASLVLNERALAALGANRKADVERPLILARAETTDAIQVLSETALHPDAVTHLEQARQVLGDALASKNHFKKVDRIERAVNHLRTAQAALVEPG